MRRFDRKDRTLLYCHDSAHVEVRCRVTPGHTRQLILEQATIYTDGWAQWAADGHIYIGYVQAGRCCDLPEVSAL